MLGKLLREIFCSWLLDISDEISKFPCETLRMKLGDAVKIILEEAKMENRLICGLDNVSKYLKEVDHPENSLFFFMTPSASVDSVTHMQEVVLQSFCFENDIYIVKLDCRVKLSNILDCAHQQVTCALIQKKLESVGDGRRCVKNTRFEEILVENCEDFWDAPIQPIVRLPEE